MFRPYLLILSLLAILSIFIYSVIVNAQIQVLHPIPIISSENGIVRGGNSNLISIPRRQFDEVLSYDNLKLVLSNTSLIYPLSKKYNITSGFGRRKHPLTGGVRFHYGIDIGAPFGKSVLSAQDGRVVFAGMNGGYGNMVMLSHSDKLRTLYAHLSEIQVQKGKSVAAGKLIGAVGSTGFSTGPHLHFEVRQNTSNGWKAIDPQNFLRSPGQSPRSGSNSYMEDLPYCDQTLWKKCVPLPSCEVALYGDCK